LLAAGSDDEEIFLISLAMPDLVFGINQEGIVSAKLTLVILSHRKRIRPDTIPLIPGAAASGMNPFGNNGEDQRILSKSNFR